MKKTIITIFTVLFIVCLAVSASAATVTWTGGGTDNLASTPYNWLVGMVPQNGDDVVFDDTSVKDCTWDIYVAPASLSLNSGYTGTLLTNSALIITGNLDISDGTLVNNGKIWVGYSTGEVPPYPPAGLTATVIAASPTRIDLSWTDNSGNETGFYIERKTGGDAYAQIADVGADVPNYSDTGLTPETTYYYKVRAYNSAGDSDYSVETSATTLDNWRDSNWLYRQKITISSAMTPDTNQTNFPLLVKITDQNNPVFDNALSNGDDILFTSSDGITGLDHEIEYYRNYITKELDIWVKMLTLSSSQDTIIYMYYGNSSAPNQENPYAVWGSYSGVWHLHDDFLDSSASSNDTVNYGSLDAAGMIGDGQKFDGIDDIVLLSGGEEAGLLTGHGQHTISAWINADDISTRQLVIAEGDCDSGSFISSGYGLYVNDGQGNTRHLLNTYDSEIDSVTSSAVDTGNWHHLAGVWNGSTGELSLYIDGINVATRTTSIGYLPDPFWGGWRLGGAGGVSDPMDCTRGHYFNGTIDEVRVTNIARSNDWIAASYNNQNNPGAYLNFGLEETKSDVSPETPSGLGAMPISSSQIDLSWTDNSGNETGFKIEQKIGVGGTYSQIAAVGADETTYSDTGLTGGTTYYYQVRAYNSAGDSAYSNEANATTASPYPTVTTDPATNITDNSVTLNAAVNPNGFETTAYFEWGADISYGNTTATRSTGSGTGNVSVSAGLTGLSANTTYHYRAVAANTNGTGYGLDRSVTTGGSGSATWTGALSNNWGDAGNCESGIVPDSTYDVVITAPDNAPVLDQAVTIWSLTIDPGGVLTLNGYSLTVMGDITINGTLDAGSSTITTGGNWSNSGSFSQGTSTVILNGTNQAIYGSTTFYNLTKSVSTADTLYFQAGSTQTIANSLTLNGAGGGLLSLRSTSTGSYWYIDPQGNRNISFVDVKDSNNISFTNIVAMDSVDSGDNINWSFGGSECVCLKNGHILSRVTGNYRRHLC